MKTYYHTESWSERRARLDDGNGWMLEGRSERRQDAESYALFITQKRRLTTRVSDQDGQELTRFLPQEIPAAS
jgi:hypothetical protein